MGATHSRERDGQADLVEDCQAGRAVPRNRGTDAWGTSSRQWRQGRPGPRRRRVPGGAARKQRISEKVHIGTTKDTPRAGYPHCPSAGCPLTSVLQCSHLR